MAGKEEAAPVAAERGTGLGPQESKDTVAWIDSLKVLAILFVVVGHQEPARVGQALVRYLFSFHMPLFFFASGFLLRPTRLNRPLGQGLRRDAQALLVPYVFFGLLSYTLWVSVTRYHFVDGIHVPVWQPLLGLLYGCGHGHWMISNVVLWFFPALFLVRQGYWGLHRLRHLAPRPVLLAGAAGLGIALLRWSPLRLPWSADVALLALPFYGAGVLLRERGPDFLARRPLAVIVTLAVSAAVQVSVQATNGPVSMSLGALGNPILFYAGAFAGIAFWSTVAELLPATRLTRFVGRRTLPIFVLHFHVFELLTLFLVFVVAVPGPVFATAWWHPYLYTTLAFVVPLALGEVLLRFLPWAVGRPRVRPEAS